MSDQLTPERHDSTNFVNSYGDEEQLAEARTAPVGRGTLR